MSPGALGDLVLDNVSCDKRHISSITPVHRMHKHQTMPFPNLWLQMAHHFLATTDTTEIEQR